MMFWIFMWLISMAAFLLLPICCVERRRKMWIRGLFSCQWSEPEDDMNETRTGLSREADPAYVLSKAQEDSIRESFLEEKLRMFTISLTSQMLTKDHSSEESEEENFKRVETNQTSASSEPSLPEEDDIEVGAVSPTKELGEQEEDNLQKDNDMESDNELALHSEQFLADGTSGVVSGLPLAGDCRHDLLPEHSQTKLNASGWSQTREVTNGCSICLSTFEEGERLTWASNPACDHAFHHACILDWLQASGQKFLKKIRRGELRGEDLEITIPDDPIERLTAFPMICPCCRQPFVLQVDGDDVSGDSKAQNNNSTETESANVGRGAGEEAV